MCVVTAVCMLAGCLIAYGVDEMISSCLCMFVREYLCFRNLRITLKVLVLIH